MVGGAVRVVAEKPHALGHGVVDANVTPLSPTTPDQRGAAQITAYGRQMHEKIQCLDAGFRILEQPERRMIEQQRMQPDAHQARIFDLTPISGNIGGPQATPRLTPLP